MKLPNDAASQIYYLTLLIKGIREQNNISVSIILQDFTHIMLEGYIPPIPFSLPDEMSNLEED